MDKDERNTRKTERIKRMKNIDKSTGTLERERKREGGKTFSQNLSGKTNVEKGT